MGTELGTGSVQPWCPPGTFSNRTGLTAESECTPCTQGYYCETDGLIEPTGPCDEGKYCQFHRHTLPYSK